MDRTLIAPWKAEGRDLSEKLHKKLLGLTLLHPPTEDFRKCLNEEMFLKPNPHAFFQVMHYLFKLHDPNEFRKRFYWPINDKKAEATFRVSTVEYLKHLDERHQLGWSIKSFLVQIPGGMKFINFMLNLVAFVIQEQIKQREKYMASDVAMGQVSDLHLKQMQKQNAFFKEYASAYISEADALIVKLEEKTALVRKKLVEMSKNTATDFDLLIDDGFAKQFEMSNRIVYEKRFSKPAANISDLEQSLASLKDVIEKFQNKKSEFQIDEDAVRQSLIKIQGLFSDHFLIAEDSRDNPIDGNVKINTLISAFNAIHASIEEQLRAADKIPRSGCFVKDELLALRTDLQQIEGQIMDFQKKLNAHTKRKGALKLQESTSLLSDLRPDCSNTQNMKGNNLLAKFVATPPIKLDVNEGSHNANTRLPFLEDFSLNPVAKAGVDSFNNLLALPSSARKMKNLNASVDLNTTFNKSKIIDPIQLLRTLNKDVSRSKILPQHDRSVLGIKWKERQNTFGKDIDASSVVEKPSDLIDQEISDEKEDNTKINDQNMLHLVSNTSVRLSPFTPLSSHDRTRIARSQLQDTSCVEGGNLSFTKKSAVKKVQDESLNIRNLSTSPSGRLDPLVTVEGKDVPIILINDVSFSEQKSAIDNSLLDSTKAIKSSANLYKNLQMGENNENDGNLTNAAGGQFVFNMSRNVDDNEELFNISDSVLKDVIF